MELQSATLALRLEKASGTVAAAALVAGCVVLMSWIWRLPGLNRIHPAFGGMGAHAAFGFVLAGGALLLVRAPVTPARRVLGIGCASALAVLSALTLAHWINEPIGSLFPGRMPTATAEVFLMFGLALLLIDVQLGRWRPTEFLTMTAVLIALLALVAYAFGSVSFFAAVPTRSLAFHSVLLMLAFAFAMLAARPRSGLMMLATSDSVAGVLVRRMVPAVVGMPVLVGWMVVELQRAGFIPPALTLAYYAVAIVVVFATMTWRTAASLHRIDVQRLEAQTEVQHLNAQLENRVAERTAQLERVNAELEAFSYSVSHDLRAPLRHIDGFAQMLLESQSQHLDASGQRHLGIICDAARNMGRMIDDLLGLARLERRHVEWQQVDLNPIVRSVMHELQRDAGARRIDWKCDVLPPVRCDSGLMKIVFTNLLSNAVKYTAVRECAVITLSLQQRPEGAVVAVSDNGAGFDQRYVHKLFGVFQRLHRAEDFEGTGIGLATVRRIVHKHGGRIWAEGAVDRGATFYFTLGPTNLRTHEPTNRVTHEPTNPPSG